MTEQSDKYDVHFYQLVIGLHAAAMQQMGKVASTLTGKIERDLDQARSSIDLLDMLKRKTDGNLSEEEQKLLDLIDKNGLRNTRLCGPLQSRAEILDVLRTHDLFACPSVRIANGDMDVIPTALIESMSAGTPVITTNVLWAC